MCSAQHRSGAGTTPVASRSDFFLLIVKDRPVVSQCFGSAISSPILMSPAAFEETQPSQSQFAHLRSTQLSTTVSGIIPGQALLDTPSPERPTVVLERSQRTRKPSTRKAEASQSEPRPSKTKGKGSADTRISKSSTKNVRSASGTNASNTNKDDQNDGSSRDDYDEDEEDISPAIVSLVEEFVGHSISHLSSRQIKNLLAAMPATQASALETQAKSTQAITQQFAGVGLAGGDRDGSPSCQDEGSFSQRQEKSTHSHEYLISQKRPFNGDDTSTSLKRVRISSEMIDKPTEDGSETESENLHHRGNAGSESDSSESEDEAGPSSSRSRKTPTGGILLTKNTSKLPPTTQTSASSARLRLSTAAAAPIPSTIPNNTPAAPKSLSNPTALFADHPPPSDLNDAAALTAWMFRLAAMQAQPLGNSSSASVPLQTVQPSATSNHVAQALASHRSRSNTTMQPEPQTTQAPQPNGTNPTTTPAPTPHNSNSTNMGATTSCPKKKRNPKAKLSDFPGRSGEIASAAIPHFLAKVFTDGAYENTEVFRDWALDAYEETWTLEFPEDEYILPPKALLTVMTRRVSWLRGEVKRRIRAIVQYGYGFKNPANSRADIKHNRRLFKKLRANVFHCRDLVPDTNYYKNNQFIRGIGAGLFWDPESLGVVFRTRFELVPLPAVALVLTMMEACISEWERGQFKLKDLDADNQQVDYERHLLSLYEYERVAEARLTRFRKKWFEAGLKYSGATNDEDQNATQPYILADHIRPDTPPLEGEDDF